MDLSVILPIYNEQENLDPLLREIHQALDSQDLDYEIIAVDDGSTDGSRQELKRLQQIDHRLMVVLFRRNYGQSAAFDAGFQSARGRVAITMDADRQNDPADIPRFLAKIEEGYDLVSGWRRKRRDGWFLRTLPSRIANGIIRRVTRTRLHDMGCSLKAYRREIYREIHLYGEMHRFLAVIAETMGARTTELEAHHRPRVAGQSKYGLLRTFKVLLDLMTIWFMKGYQTKPIYVFGGLGMALMGLTGILCAWVLYDRFFLDVFVHKNPLFLIAVTTFLVSTQFFAFGLLAEILVRIYFESQSKPSYVISERHGFPVGSARDRESQAA